MRPTSVRCQILVVLAVLFLALAAGAVSALLLKSEPAQPARFKVLSISPPQPDGSRTASVLIRNISDGTIEYQCAEAASSQHIRPRCEFSQPQPDGEKRWSSEPSRSSRFLNLGQEVLTQIEFPDGPPVKTGIYLRKLPHVVHPGPGTWNRLKLAVISLRVRIALRKTYEPCWLPEPLTASPNHQPLHP